MKKIYTIYESKINKFCHHTCKGKLCSSCGIKTNKKVTKKILEVCLRSKHRHITFTIPEDLRMWFFNNLQTTDLLFSAVCETLYSIVNGKVKKNKRIYDIKYTPGFFAFLHTFGRDMKWNPHIHVLLAEIKLTKDKCEDWNYFSFNALRKRFMRNLLELMSKELGPSFDSMKNKMYKKHKKGFYVYAKKKKFKKLKHLIEYNARYCGRPAISESRILNYDGENVTFCYNDHNDNSYHEVTVTAFEFIAMLLRHIIPENFKPIRYFGFYRKKSPLHEQLIKMISNVVMKIRKSILNHKMCIIKFFKRNP